MIGGFEQVVPIQSITPLDTDLMKTYIAGVRELYNLARDDWKQFIKEYGDFYSPIEADNQRYYDMTRGAAKSLIDKYGSDILRSPEGRAAISNLIGGVDMALIAKIKASADNAKLYLAHRAELQSKGLWDPDMENFRLNGKDISTWDSTQNGVWQELSPIEKKDLNQLTSHFYDQFLKDEYLGPGKRKFHDMVGISEPNIQKGTTAAAIGILNSDYGKYYKEVAKRQVLAKNPYLSGSALEKATQDQLEYNIRIANQEKLQPKEQINEVGLKMWELSQQNYRAQLSAGSKDNKDPKTPYSFSQHLLSTILRNAGMPQASDVNDETLKLKKQKHTNWLSGNTEAYEAGTIAFLMPGFVNTKSGAYVFSGVEDLRNYKGEKFQKNSPIIRNILNNDDPKAEQWKVTGNVKGLYEKGEVRIYCEVQGLMSDTENGTKIRRTLWVASPVKSNNVSSGFGHIVVADQPTTNVDMGYNIYVRNNRGGVVREEYDDESTGVED